MEHSIKHVFDKDNKMMIEFIDFLMGDLTIDKAKNPFLTEKKAHLQLQEFLGASKIRERIKHGIQLLFDDLSGHLSQPEMRQVREECNTAADTIITMMQEKGAFDEVAHKLEELPDHLQGILHFSETTYQHFYESGNRYFKAKRYQEAGDIFFLLSTLNPLKPHVLIALGLTETHLDRHQDALQAFTAAALLDSISPYPHIYSAQCYLALKDEENTQATIDYALQIIDEHPTSESAQMKAYLLKLKNE